MSEQSETPVETRPDGEQVRTGVPEVDAVLADVESLAGRPVEEHVEVFERAHETLRRALDVASPTDPA